MGVGTSSGDMDVLSALVAEAGLNAYMTSTTGLVQLVEHAVDVATGTVEVREEGGGGAVWLGMESGKRQLMPVLVVRRGS